MKALILVFLCLAADFAVASCPEHGFVDPQRVRLDQRPLLIATHASSSFDANFSAKRGVDEAIRFARDMNYQVVYLQDDRDDPNYYMEMCKPDYWVHSEGGEVNFDIPATQVFLVGGHLELCLANTMNQLLDRWAGQTPRDRTVQVLMDGVYSNGASIDESTPFFRDMERFMHIRSYGRPAGEHWGKASLLEVMGVIIKEDQQLRYLETVLPQWRRSFPSSYRVELQVEDSAPRVLQRGSGLRAPVLKFHFVSSAVTLVQKRLFPPSTS